MNGKGYLLKFIEANGGSIPSGAFAAVMNQCIDAGLVKTVFPKAVPKTIKDHITYTYDLTETGKRIFTGETE